jgi:hypothetical protein
MTYQMGGAQYVAIALVVVAAAGEDKRRLQEVPHVSKPQRAASRAPP